MMMRSPSRLILDVPGATPVRASSEGRNSNCGFPNSISDSSSRKGGQMKFSPPFIRRRPRPPVSLEPGERAIGADHCSIHKNSTVGFIPFRLLRPYSQRLK